MRKKRDGPKQPGHIELELGGTNGSHGGGFGPRALTLDQTTTELGRDVAKAMVVL